MYPKNKAIGYRRRLIGVYIMDNKQMNEDIYIYIYMYIYIYIYINIYIYVIL